MITYNKMEPQTVELWNDIGFFARVNEYEFNDIRCQIKKEKVEGFYALYNGVKIIINKSGKCERWPDGFFDHWEKCLFELL